MLTIKIQNNHIEITGVPTGCRVTTIPDPAARAADPPLVSGIYRYRGDDRRVLALAEETWFQLQRSSDGIKDFFPLPVPPMVEEIEIVPDHQATQEQLLLFELASKLAETAEVYEIWVFEDDHFYRADSGRVFRLLQSGVLRLQEVPELPTGARLTLMGGPLINELCDAADELDNMDEPRETPDVVEAV